MQDTKLFLITFDLSQHEISQLDTQQLVPEDKRVNLDQLHLSTERRLISVRKFLEVQNMTHCIVLVKWRSSQRPLVTRLPGFA